MIRSSLIALLVLLAPPAVAWQPCPAFTGGFETQDLSGHTYTTLVHDDGSGPALYVGGSFLGAGSVLATNLARWDGTAWSAVGGAIDGPVGSAVRALATFDDGAGLELIAAGSFAEAGGVAASNIAAWNGTSWRPLGAGTNGAVRALLVWDDGTGPALYAAGTFSQAGGSAARSIARWRNGAWSPLGLGLSYFSSTGTVHALTSFDFGAGPRLVAGGSFNRAGGAPADFVATWDGSAWSPLGTGLPSLCCWDGVLAFAAFDEGQGLRLFASGSDVQSADPNAEALVRWNGTAWSSVHFGSGFLDHATFHALSVYDDGTGPALYCAGLFQQVPGIGFANLARWDGASWSLGGPALTWSAYTIARFDDGLGGGTKTYLGGGAGSGNLEPGPKSFGRLDPSGWSALDPTVGTALPASDSVVHDDGGGARLFLAGNVFLPNGTWIERVAAWDGASWSAVGTLGTLSPTVEVLASLEIAGQRALYAGLSTPTPSSQLVRRWDGAQWTTVPGVFNIGASHFVAALAVFDGGDGPQLVAGGRFTAIDGAPRNRIARFDGTSWHPLGAGFDDNVYALAVVDAGDGPSLYAGGLFTTAIGVPGTSRIARWDGTQWHSVGGGITGDSTPIRVVALQGFDDGTGMALYAAGRFVLAGGQFAPSIARFRNGVWSPLGSGSAAEIVDLGVLDRGDGAGAELVACGAFDSIGGVSARGLASWTGSTWRTFESGGYESVDGTLTSLAVGRVGAEPGEALYLTGSFRRAGEHPSVNVARFQGCDQPGAIACSGDGSGAACPCANPGVFGGGCTNSLGRSASLRASGVPSLTNDSLVLRGANMTPSSTCLYFQGTTIVGGGAGVAFGDGLRCAGGSVIRLGFATNAAGASQFPPAGGTALSTAGGVTSEGTRVYQCWYRDAASFCTSATFNLTNALVVDWRP